MIKLFTAIALLLSAPLALANDAPSFTHDKFKGEARENGKLVYIENHDVTLDAQGSPLEATTTYTSPEGQVLATLRSDFRKSLNLPDHTYEDARTKARYGIRRQEESIVMFNQDAKKQEETKTLSSKSESERLQVGCQGFNYYLFGKVDAIKQKKVLPVLFMIPGDLSTYDFELEFVSEDSNQIAKFLVKIENWFLRIFAPKLEFHYDRKINRIVWYKGLSNIKNEKGKLMNVIIEYKY